MGDASPLLADWPIPPHAHYGLNRRIKAYSVAEPQRMTDCHDKSTLTKVSEISNLDLKKSVCVTLGEGRLEKLLTVKA